MKEVELNVTEFVKTALEELKFKFPMISIRCEININSVIVEILPYETYDSDKQYSDEEIKVQQYLETHLPLYDILFVSTASLIQIKNPTFSL